MTTGWQKFLERWINFYPPLFGAGIRARRIDAYTTRVDLKLTPLNRNIVGTHFGGSLYAMCDPWFMLILMHNLGNGYIVWDKAAAIQFLRPGRGKVTATFHIPAERVQEIRSTADRQGKVEPSFTVEVTDEQNQIVARVDKLLYVRKNNDSSPA